MLTNLIVIYKYSLALAKFQHLTRQPNSAPNLQFTLCLVKNNCGRTLGECLFDIGPASDPASCQCLVFAGKNSLTMALRVVHKIVTADF